MFISSALSISDYKFALYDLLAFRFRIEAREINLVNNSRSTNYLCFLCKYENRYTTYIFYHFELIVLLTFHTPLCNV